MRLPTVSRENGFTIIELVIVIAVMGILSVFLLMQIFDTQIKARDVEREEDAATISRELELIYTNKLLGTPSYPNTSQIMQSSTQAYFPPESLRSPKINSISLVVATNATATTAGVTPSPTKATYVYQPLTSGNLLCTSGYTCVKYNLFYRTELDNAIKQIRSSRQQ